jgi:glycolate oxidase
VLRTVREVAQRHNVRIANVFHAGDGNLHPLILFAKESELEGVKQAGLEILEACVAAGGSITGEHGVGMEKNCFMPLQFSADDLATMGRVKTRSIRMVCRIRERSSPLRGRCREFQLAAAR